VFRFEFQLFLLNFGEISERHRVESRKLPSLVHEALATKTLGTRVKTAQKESN
jgi:hypothetical protein